ncbi:helix-turn-helix domain-containing protein [Tumebacillus lipolyticus]|uniref:Helix-turn-helix domain-containing protein n=1 Tax=Tumebacillus lipolyticus TaxID=1280370 RepID=A0ABW5A0Z0_9BACL
MQELGAELKRIREQKGYTLEQIQQATKIRTRYLEAIEAGELSVMPGIVYARGFIKSYCDYLGVDGQAMLEQYGLAVDKDDEQVEPVRVKRKDRNIGKVGSFNTRLLPQVAMVVGILVVAAAVYAVLVNLEEKGVSKDPAETQSVEKPQQVETPTPAPDPEPEPPKQTTAVQEAQKAANQTTYQVTGTDSMTMVLATTSDCWLEVKADGKVLESGIVKAGETRTWKANQSISLLTGKSKFITIKINDQAVQIEPFLRGYTYLFNLKS